VLQALAGARAPRPLVFRAINCSLLAFPDRHKRSLTEPVDVNSKYPAEDRIASATWDPIPLCLWRGIRVTMDKGAGTAASILRDLESHKKLQEGFIFLTICIFAWH